MISTNDSNAFGMATVRRALFGGVATIAISAAFAMSARKARAATCSNTLNLNNILPNNVVSGTSNAVNCQGNTVNGIGSLIGNSNDSNTVAITNNQIFGNVSGNANLGNFTGNSIFGDTSGNGNGAGYNDNFIKGDGSGNLNGANFDNNVVFGDTFRQL